MNTDRTLSNAPLLEVMVEVQWEIAGEASGPQHDPHWFELVAHLGPVLARRLPLVERLAPEGISMPLDLFGRSPLRRFRPEGGGWPLVQLGQGLLTVNAVPPYDGWAVVSALLRDTLTDCLHGSSIFPGLKPSLLKLQYRDAFNAKHGVENIDTALQEFFPLVNSDATSALSAVGALQPAARRLELTGVLPELSGSVSVVAVTGSVNRESVAEKALIVDFIIQGLPDIGTMDAERILQWFERAHDLAWRLFQLIVPPKVMSQIKGD